MNVDLQTPDSSDFLVADSAVPGNQQPTLSGFLVCHRGLHLNLASLRLLLLLLLLLPEPEEGEELLGPVVFAAGKSPDDHSSTPL